MKSDKNAPQATCKSSEIIDKRCKTRFIRRCYDNMVPQDDWRWIDKRSNIQYNKI